MTTDWEAAGRAVEQQRGHLGPTKGWRTREDAAAASLIDAKTWQKVEKGRGATCRESNLSAIAGTLGWDPDQIQRIAAGEPPPWRAAAERATALEAQVAALAEQITTLQAHVSRADARHDAEVQRVSDEVRQLSRLVERLAPRDE